MTGYYVATAVVVPALAPAGLGLRSWSYGALGRDPVSAAAFVLTHPLATTRVVFARPKDTTLFLLFVQAGFLNVASVYFLL